MKTNKVKALATMMKNVALKNCETKKSSLYTGSSVALFHNLAYYADNLQRTNQGLSDPEGFSQATRNRIGDEVIARGLKIKWFMENEADRPNVMWKIIVFRYNTLEAATTPLTDPYFWRGTDGVGGNMNRMLDAPNPERVKVIKEILIKPTNQANYSIQTAGPVPVGPFVKTNLAEIYIPLNNRKIQYNDADSRFVRFTDIGFAVTVYDAINTAQTDQLANLQWVSTFYYKDP
ncbi:hypothetical protein [Shewanella sp.]|uniref:hypothetical protein n=1 Tax=Shewanella sp. TaxID=50422 RepID=UPI004047ED24